MEKCLNCEFDLTGNYCGNCGQKLMKDHSFSNSLNELLGDLDLNKGFVKTFVLLFTRPGRLVNNYLNGKTRKYMHPVGFLLVIIGFYYLLAELNVIDSRYFSSNQFILILEILVPTIVLSGIMSVIRLFEYTLIKALIVNIFFVSGYFAILFFTNSLSDLFWKYDSIYNFALTIFLIILSLLFYFSFYIAVFKRRKLVKLLIVSLLFPICIFSYSLFYTKYLESDINKEFQISQLPVRFDDDDDFEQHFRYLELPGWVRYDLVGNDRIMEYEQDTLVANNMLIANFDNSIERDFAFALRSRANSEQHLVICNYSSSKQFFSADFHASLPYYDSLASIDNSLQLYLDSKDVGQISWDGYKYSLNAE